MAAQLKGIGELFSATWERYKQRALPILAVTLLGSLLVLAVVLALGLGLAQLFGGLQAVVLAFQAGGPPPPGFFWGMAAMVLAGTFFGMWNQSAILAAAVRDDLGVFAALGEGYRRMWSVAWVLFLAGAIVLAGSVALLVPAILFGVWFAFAVVVLFAEDRRGLEALLASRAYVRGHWWPVFGRLLLVSILAALLGLVPVAGQLLSLLFTPFLLLFLVVLYEDLKEAAGGAAEPEGRRVLWGGLAAVGALLPVAGMAAAVVPQWPLLVQRLQGNVTCPRPGGQPVRPPAGGPHRDAGGTGYGGGGGPGMSRQAGQGGAGAGRRQSAQAVAGAPSRPAGKPGIGAQQGREAATSVQWSDPAGDVSGADGGPAADITAVGIAAGRDRLSVAVQLASPLDEVVSRAASGGPASFVHLLTLFLDTDGDPATGSVPAGRVVRGGYEQAVAFTLEGGSGTVERRVHFSIYRLSGERWTAVKALALPLRQGDRMLTFGIPYRAAGITAGSRVRLCFLEGGQHQGAALSDDAVLVAP